MFLFGKKRKQQEELVEQVQVQSVEELFGNIEKLKEQFLLVKDDVEARDERIAELEKQLENKQLNENDKDNKINELEEKVKELEEIIANVNKLVNKK